MDKARVKTIKKTSNNEEEFGVETSEFIKSLSGLTPNQRSMVIANKLLEEILSLKKILLRIEREITGGSDPEREKLEYRQGF